MFSILISNTDDHLRNHGFLYERERGWYLSPAYDLNPTPVEVKPRILTTMIDLYDGTASLDLALSVANNFQLTKTHVETIIREVAGSVPQWREIAQSFNLEKREIDRMASAFEHAELMKAMRV